jgi:hypothetical protein
MAYQEGGIVPPCGTRILPDFPHFLDRRWSPLPGFDESLKLMEEHG